MSVSLASIVTEAEKFVGAPYVYGGTNPGGWDCSGFVQYVLSKQGITGVPRTSEQQWGWVTQIQKSQLQPGDLVFAQFPGDNASPGHVGIYVGNDKVLSAEDPAQGTNYSSLSSWGNAVVGYGRVPTAGDTGQSATLTSVSGDISNPLSWTGDYIKGMEWAGKWVSGATIGPITSEVQGLSGITGGLVGITQALSKIGQLFALLLQPRFWLRVGAFFTGLIALLAGGYFLKGAIA